MTTHLMVSRDKWLEARLDLLAAEKDLTRRSDQVAQLRRQLPWVKIDKELRLRWAQRPAGLAELFEGRRQLLVQHFMLAPGWEQGCPSCSYMADHTDGMTVISRIATSRSSPSHARRSPRSSAFAGGWAGGSSGCPRTAPLQL